MSNLDLDKWWDLRNQSVEIVIDNYATRMELTTLKKIERFEFNTQIILPNEYKEFCLVFGAGSFGINYFNMWCLPNADIARSDFVVDFEGMLDYNQIIMQSFKQGCRWNSEHEKVLDSGLIFGTGDNKGTFFLFDISSYSEEDLSCNIYGYDCDGIDLSNQEYTGTSYFFGRSFFDFIKDVCLGDRAQTEYPELLSRMETDEDDDPKPEYWNRKTFIVSGGFSRLDEDWL